MFEARIILSVSVFEMGASSESWTADVQSAGVAVCLRLLQRLFHRRGILVTCRALILEK